MSRMLLTFAIGLWLSVVNCASSSAQDKMRMGLSSVSALHSAVWIAEQKGLFRKHGIDIEVIVTGQGGTAVSALLAGDIQTASSAGDALMNATLHGGDTVMIAGVINKGLQRIMVRPEIKTPADLKGKKNRRDSHRRGLSLRPSDDAKTVEHESERCPGDASGLVSEYAGRVR